MGNKFCEMEVLPSSVSTVLCTAAVTRWDAWVVGLGFPSCCGTLRWQQRWLLHGGLPSPFRAVLPVAAGTLRAWSQAVGFSAQHSWF